MVRFDFYTALWIRRLSLNLTTKRLDNSTAMISPAASLTVLLVSAAWCRGSLASMWWKTEQEVLGESASVVDGPDPAFGPASSPWGLTTYANIPHEPCLSDKSDISYDIAILGAPFDTVSTVQASPHSRYRPGVLTVSLSSFVSTSSALNLIQDS